MGIIGGAAEWSVGGVGEWFSGGGATLLTVPLFTDGGVRIASNFTRCLGYFSGHQKFAESFPTNIGAAIGKVFDMSNGKSFYEYGYGQAFGGSVNDFASFIITGGSAQPLADMMENPTIWNTILYGSAIPGYGLGLYDDIIPLEKK